MQLRIHRQQKKRHRSSTEVANLRPVVIVDKAGALLELTMELKAIQLQADSHVVEVVLSCRCGETDLGVSRERQYIHVGEKITLSTPLSSHALTLLK